MKRPEKLAWYGNEFNKIHCNVKNKECLSHYDFLMIRNFKLQNLTTEDGTNIEKISKEAFKLAKEDKIKESIRRLLELNGVAIPIASTILAMKYPERFAIIDKRVIKALRKNEWLKDYLKSPEIYEKYLLVMRNLAKEKGISLRKLERGLFEKE